MTSIQSWVGSVQSALKELQQLDLGFPLGDNEVVPPQSQETVATALRIAQLTNVPGLPEFYSCCDGVSLPDIHVGYFIKSVTKLGEEEPASEPVEIQGEFSGRLVTIGSTGGGGLFVLRRATCDVLYLPPGPLCDGIYDGTDVHVKQVSVNFPSFLDVLLEDVKAFVESWDHHRFIC